LVFHADPPELQMAFDEVKMQHILYNLLSNALKFTPAGGSVTVSVNQVLDKGIPYLELSVADTGIGIAQEAIPHIFERYFQAEHPTDPEILGTGIGLTLTHELIRFMEGTVEVHSQLGRGSTFRVLLPVLQAPEAPRQKLSRQPDAAVQLQEQTAPASGQDPTTALPQLLLIEDNPDVRTYIQTLLEDQYAIQIAKDGQAGIELALEQIPDIIITDVMMPRKNGFEVCQTLKKDVRTSHIPIIMLTAKATQDDKVTGLEQGADAYLMKPFDKSELLIRLRKLIELRKTLQQKYQGDALLHTDRIEKPSIEDTFLLNLRQAVEKHMAQPENTLDLIGRELGLSSMQLYRKLKALADTTPSLFVRSVRLEAAANLLLSTDLNVSEIAYEVGFNDPAYFSRAFKEKFNQTPSEFKTN
ncbi:MAG: response regulator, partial [Phaeodactylibacter sp.]|nr:response regulator [Phaeodactylibacter sp.]